MFKGVGQNSVVVLTRGGSGLLRALVVVVRLGVEPIDGTADTLQRVDDLSSILLAMYSWGMERMCRQWAHIINRDGFGLTVLAVRDAITEDLGFLSAHARYIKIISMISRA